MKGLRWIGSVIAIVALAVPIFAAATIASTTFKEQACHAVFSWV